MTFDMNAFSVALKNSIMDTAVSIDAMHMDTQLGRLFVTATHSRPPATYSDELSLMVDGDGIEVPLAQAFADLINKGAPLI